MKRILILLVVGGACLWWGTQNTYVALRDRTQLEISCAEYVKKRPDAHWLKLTNCEYDFDHLAVEARKNGKITKVYLPLRPAGEESGQPTRIVVVRDDEEMLSAAQGLEQDEAALTTADARVTTSLHKPAEGVVKFGIDLNDNEKKQLATLGLGLDKDFVLLDGGAKPNLQKGLIVMMIGLGALGILAFLVMRRFRKPKPSFEPESLMPIRSAFERPV